MVEFREGGTDDGYGDFDEALESASGDATLPSVLDLQLRVRDREVIEALLQYEDLRERSEFARQALRIGILALRQASGQLDVEAIRNEGEQLVHEFESRVEVLNQDLKNELGRYFDPKSGQLQQRVDNLIKKGGELESVLHRFVDAEDSVLAQALQKQVGENSPLRTFLDPDNAGGFVQQLRDLQDKARERILGEFSLDRPDSALSRLVVKLREQNADVTKELDLGNEQSALNRMMGKVEQAQKTIVAEFSLDNEQSALKRMLDQLQGELKAQRESGQKFQEDVRVTLEAFQARKQERDKGTGHGVDFEDSLFRWLQEHCAGHVVEQTGNIPGTIKHNKKGDVVVTIGADHSAAGARVVFEAKKDVSYQLPRALAELAEARLNRAAQIGVFVYSTASAPAGQEPFLRQGDDLVVIWDHEDEQSDIYLSAAWSVATALALRARAEGEVSAADLPAMDGAIANIEKRLDGLNEIQKVAGTVENSGKKISERARIMLEQVQRELKTLREQLDNLRS